MRPQRRISPSPSRHRDDRERQENLKPPLNNRRLQEPGLSLPRLVGHSHAVFRLESPEADVGQITQAIECEALSLRSEQKEKLSR
jgi:hypothetical protein